MQFRYLTTSIAAALLVGACSQAQDAAEKTVETAKTAGSEAMDAGKKTMSDAKQAAQEVMPGVDIGALPSGTYNADSGHAYIAFSYSHQGYSKPVLRWGAFDATVNLDNENPENSTVSVSIPVASIDSGVADFNDHLVSADFFDAQNHPTITFNSTAVNQSILGSGTLTGDLTIKDVTKPVELKVKLNKTGKHFRSQKDMFGISAKGKIKRSEFGVDKYAPMADDVELTIEVEFQKAD